jgi:hypothetical protein
LQAKKIFAKRYSNRGKKLKDIAFENRSPETIDKIFDRIAVCLYKRNRRFKEKKEI